MGLAHSPFKSPLGPDGAQDVLWGLYPGIGQSEVWAETNGGARKKVNSRKVSRILITI